MTTINHENDCEDDNDGIYNYNRKDELLIKIMTMSAVAINTT